MKVDNSTENRLGIQLVPAQTRGSHRTSFGVVLSKHVDGEEYVPEQLFSVDPGVWVVCKSQKDGLWEGMEEAAAAIE